MKEIDNFTIEELRNEYKISNRTYNRCIDAKLLTLMDLIKFYEERKSFLEIKGAGKKVRDELESLCNEYIQILNTSDNEILTNNIENTIQVLENLSYKQRIILERKFLSISSASEKRRICRLGEMGFERFFVEYLFASNDKLLDLQGIGEKSIDEIVELKNKMKECYDYLNRSSDEEILFYFLSYTLNSNIPLNDFAKQFHSNNNHLPMFWILEQLLLEDKSKNIDILVSSFPVFQNIETYTLEEISNIYNVTRERIRQIRNNVYRKIFKISEDVINSKEEDEFYKIFMFLQYKDDWSYVINLINDLESLNQESLEIKELLDDENCNFTTGFILHIISYIFHDEFSLLGEFGVPGSSNSKIIFLIRKKYSDVFIFDEFIEQFSTYVTKNEIEHSLEIEKFLLNITFWFSEIDTNAFEGIVKIVKDIIKYNFSLIPNNDNTVIIPATKKRKTSDVVYEILLNNGQPMHVNDIFKKLIKELPNNRYTEVSQILRILRDHEKITHRNRNSIYTLKEWTHVKSGTIRDAVFDFLNQNELPKSADEITNYVLQHFHTSKKSIRASIFSDSLNRFCFFKKDLFGLEKKQYSDEYEKIEVGGFRKSFEQRIDDFEEFIINNKRLPCCARSSNEEEKSLFRWWKIQNKSNNSDKIKSIIENIPISKNI